MAEINKKKKAVAPLKVEEEKSDSLPSKEMNFSNTEEIQKSEVLNAIKKKKRSSIPDPKSLLSSIKNAEDTGEINLNYVKQQSDQSKNNNLLIDDETVELKVIKEFTAGFEKRKKFASHFHKKQKQETKTISIDLSSAVRFQPDLETGLSSIQVEERKINNFTNESKTSYTKGVGRIFFDNIFTFFNMMLTLIAIALIAVGSFTDLFFMAIAIINTGFGIGQEIKAKLTMDKLRLVTAPTCSVLRDGQTIQIPTEQIVLDDIMLISIGNQIASDSIVQKGSVEVNESLLTGESLPIKKVVGDLVYAGSFVVSGSAAVCVDKVGEANYSSSIQIKAKQYSKPKSELVKALNTIIRAVSVAIIPLAIILFTLNYLNSNVAEVFIKVKDAIESTAGSLIGMIPAGMYLLTTVALMSGVINITRRQTVVRELYCIEMLARVNVLCLDKTGTLTDGTMNVEEIVVLDKSYNVTEVMGSYLSSFEENNQTSIALQQAFNFNSIYRVKDKIPFSSSRKYSAVDFEKVGTFLLGAPEFIYDIEDPVLKNLIAEKQSRGFRVLMLAHTNAAIKKDKIVGAISPVAIFILIDHIRPEAPATIKWFKENDVEVKIISGDNPLTASEIAQSCGVDNAQNWVSLDGLSINEVAEIADKYTVFGRVSPEQKAALVKALKTQQKVVAMTGDGVNDILAMKCADCSIAMASGADAAKSVAHLVLLNSNFSSMPKVVEEGRRVINNIQRSSSLFLMKTIFTMCLTIFVIIANMFGSKMTYPFSPKNLMIMEVFCIGVPSFFLALQPNKNRINGHFLRNVIFRALPGAFLLLLAVAVTMILGNAKFYDFAANIDKDEAIKTMAVISMVICGLAMLYQICKPVDVYRALLCTLMLIGAILALFILPKNFIGINYSILNKTQWLVTGILAFASLPISALLDSIFSNLRNDGARI